MTPTRRIPEAPKPPVPQRTRPAGTARAGEPGAATAVAAASAPAKVDGNVKTTAPSDAYKVTVDVSLAASARTDTQRIDRERLSMLKEQVRSGSYQADPKALAARIAEEALEPAALE